VDRIAADEQDFVTRGNVGKATVMADGSYRALQIYGLPSRLEREAPKGGAPTSVVRRVTVDLVDRLDQASKASSSSARLVLSGDRGSGKSTLLYQAANYCHGQKWIVIYVPKSESLSSFPSVDRSLPSIPLQPTIGPFKTVGRRRQ
jgi:small subunit ribosomal protein S29